MVTYGFHGGGVKAAYVESSMRAYVARRGIQLAIDVWLLSIALFALAQFMGLSCRLSGRIRAGVPQCIQVSDHNPLPVRYLEMVGAYLRGDFGTDTAGHAALPIIAANIVPTLALVALCWAVVQIVAVPLAVFWTTKRGTATDGLLKALAWVGIVTPSFLISLFLIDWVVVDAGLPSGLFGPTPSLLSGPWLSQLGRHPLATLGTSAEHLVVPVLTVVIFWAAIRARLLREALGRVSDEPYIRSARAKGLSSWRVIFRYKLANCAPVLPGDTGIYVWVIANLAFVSTSFQVLGGMYASTDVSILAIGVFAVGILLIRLLGDILAAWRNPALRDSGRLGFA